MIKARENGVDAQRKLGAHVQSYNLLPTKGLIETVIFIAIQMIAMLHRATIE